MLGRGQRLRARENGEPWGVLQLRRSGRLGRSSGGEEAAAREPGQARRIERAVAREARQARTIERAALAVVKAGQLQRI